MMEILHVIGYDRCSLNGGKKYGGNNNVIDAGRKTNISRNVRKYLYRTHPHFPFFYNFSLLRSNFASSFLN